MTRTEGHSPTAWPVDWLHVWFILPLLAVWAWSRETADHWWLWLSADFLILAWLGAIQSRSHTWSLRRAALWRLVHGTVAVPLVFTQVGLSIAACRPVDHARTLEALDRWMFLGHNPLEALERVSGPWLTEVMQWAYTAYLLLPITAVLILVVRGTPRQITRSLFSLLGVMYLSYVGYFVVPASGPNLHNNLGPLQPVPIPTLPLYHFETSLPGLWCSDGLRAWMFEAELTKKDCFPSGHVAVAIVCWWIARSVDRRTSTWFLPVMIGVVLSTVYLRYHYVADVLGGILLAWFGLGPWLGVHDWIAARLHLRLDDR